ncbi:anti-repressor SinI family protein [Halobacillus sp. H74]|uniref:anti-repressor SinI family protein n=1 Tax=Halobacillus sp. H74 TaxID=3457436 RepID=UPI003FCD3CE7
MNDMLKNQLKRVYEETDDLIMILQVSGICADEFSFGKNFEDMTEAEKIENDFEASDVAVDGIINTDYEEIVISTNVNERRFILEVVTDIFEGNKTIEDLFETDKEWKDLITEAKEAGLSIDEVREFIKG